MGTPILSMFNKNSIRYFVKISENKKRKEQKEDDDRLSSNNQKREAENVIKTNIHERTTEAQVS